MTNKTFISKWKAGMAKATPLQLTEATQKGNWVMLLGIITGIIVMVFNKSFWWIEIILVASLFNHAIVMIGNWQKIKQFREVEKMFNEPIIEQQLKGGAIENVH